MADDVKNLESIQIRFASGALPDDDVRLLGVLGREEISRLFEFDLILERPERYTDAELDQLLKAPCAVALGPKPGDVVHGLLQSIEEVDHERNVTARYFARMVPNLWLLTITQTSRLFQDMTVPEIVTKILQSYGLGSDNFDLRVNLDAKSPKREYVVQYQESDWDFIQRWLEHEGFFYWFDHGAAEKLVISDENADATPIDDPSVISYRERNNISAGRLATVWDWTLVQKRIPARVALLDHNYRRPATPLIATEVVDAERGFGTRFLYGDHFKDVATGKALAALRAERIRCERRIFKGRTDCSRFRVGHVFELENHFEDGNDGKYLITRIEHRVGYPVHADRLELGTTPQRYLARFEALPMKVPYRPERITPWPRIAGVMHAHIDADTNGDYASIDGEGRYKVRMPYDVNLNKGGKASRWIRMAQPYAGAGYGQHHPLHKGTEVLVAHVDGDPDRPIILSAVPNPHTLSPSTSSNATQSVTQTASGIRVEMEDLQS
ncbi:MAG: type VI secretion system tip protein VgrG [Polyangiaceae bacterium]|nr:type VI secretion system tip protein VgrG [Polyangiaceae bacterium]